MTDQISIERLKQMTQEAMEQNLDQGWQPMAIPEVAKGYGLAPEALRAWLDRLRGDYDHVEFTLRYPMNSMDIMHDANKSTMAAETMAGFIMEARGQQGNRFSASGGVQLQAFNLAEWGRKART